MKNMTMLGVALTLIACSPDKASESEERELPPEKAQAHLLDDQEMERKALEREAQREAESQPE